MSQRNEFIDIVLGMLLVFGLHILAIAIGGLIGSVAISLSGTGTALGSAISALLVYALFFIGISQLVYILPIIFWLRRRQKWGLMKGVIIGAVLTALLNGGCWLLLSSQW